MFVSKWLNRLVFSCDKDDVDEGKRGAGIHIRRHRMLLRRSGCLCLELAHHYQRAYRNSPLTRKFNKTRNGCVNLTNELFFFLLFVWLQSCVDEKVTDKSVYSTFSRTLSPSNKISKSVVSLLLEFSWDQVFLVVDHQPEFLQIAEAIEVTLFLLHQEPFSLIPKEKSYQPKNKK